MTSTTGKSGFIEQAVTVAGINMLPAPQMAFAGFEGAHNIPYVFYPVLFQMNPRGLIAIVRSFGEMYEGQKIQVSWSSDRGTTTVDHIVEGHKDQAIGFTEAQALIHQGEQVTVTYTALIEGEARPSLPSRFTIAKAELDLENLPEIQPLDVVNGVIKLKDIESQGGARFSLPPVKGLHRGTALALTLVSGELRRTIGRLILTTPDVDVKFMVPYRDVAMFIGRETAFHYAIWLLEDISYNSGAHKETFRVEL